MIDGFHPSEGGSIPSVDSIFYLKIDYYLCFLYKHNCGMLIISEPAWFSERCAKLLWTEFHPAIED